ncbi:Lon protease family protein, partial [Proteus terrae]
MTITKLTRTDLAPDMEPYQALFAQADLSQPAPSLSGDLQPRLFYALEQLLCTPAVSSFMLVKAPEEPEYLQWLTAETRTLHEPTAPLYGVRYDVDGPRVTLSP